MTITCFSCGATFPAPAHFCGNCGRDLNSRNLDAGTRVASYRIMRVLGKGGIGAVYLAHHQFLEQLVAIKIHDYFPTDQYVGTAFFRASNYW